MKEVVFRGIRCVSFAEPHSMGIMSSTRICLQNTTLATFARGIARCFNFVKYLNSDFNLNVAEIVYYAECRQHPGQYEYYKNYDDLEVSKY